MAAGKQIPQCLVQAFRDAMLALRDFSFGGPAPIIMLDGKGCSIGEIADLAAKYDDPMPTDIYDHLCQTARFGRRPEDRSFAAGGWLLRREYSQEQTQRIKAAST